MHAAGAGSSILVTKRSIWRLKNVEPSAQSSDGDASHRRFHGGARTGANAESRGRQEPVPDLCRYLQRLPQEPARPVEDRAARIAVELPAPALHDKSGYGECAHLLSRLKWRERHPLCRRSAEGWQGWRQGWGEGWWQGRGQGSQVRSKA